jgi:hypothetical protein
VRGEIAALAKTIALPLVSGHFAGVILSPLLFNAFPIETELHKSQAVGLASLGSVYHHGSGQPVGGSAGMGAKKGFFRGSVSIVAVAVQFIGED